MRIKKLAKKFVAYACIGALAAGPITGINNNIALADMEDTSALTATNLVKTWGSVEGDAYAYEGYVGCDAGSEYKYLKLTYTGDATALDAVRWQMMDSSDIAIGTFWFRENAEGTIKTVDNTEVPAPSSEEQTVIIDFEKSGIDTTYGIQALHFHNTQGYGTVTITSAEFLTQLQEEPSSGEVSTDDIILSGDENGASSMIGTYVAPGREPSDVYKYLGFVTLKEATPEYRYLIITYTGNITQLRFEFEENVDGNKISSVGPYWFNKEGQEHYFVTADGSDIPLEGNETTIVIDLVATGIDLSKHNFGVHMHCDLMATYGNFEIGYARLSTSAEMKDEDKMPQEPETQAPTTEAPTTKAPGKVNPTTKEPETQAPTTKPAKPKRVKVIKASKKKASKKLKVSFKKVSKVKGYKVQVSKSKKFKKVLATKTVKKSSIKSITVKSKKVKNIKKLYVRVKAYKLNGKRKVWGSWSKVKRVTVK